MSLFLKIKNLLFGRKVQIEILDIENFPYDVLSKKEAKEFFYKQGAVLACKKEEIYSKIDSTPDAGLEYLYNLFQMSWCKHWAEVSAKPLMMMTSDNFILLSYDDERRNRILLQFAEKSFDMIYENLQIKMLPYGKQLIFHLNKDEYYDLEDSLEKPESSEEVLTGGMFVRSVIPYMVFHSEKGQNLPDIVLAHELTHALLSMTDIPTWLNEALACTMEKTITGECHYDWTLEQGLKNLNYWDAITIQKFWVGESFFINASQDFSYLLAQGLLNTIIRLHRNKFRDFINNAKRSDAGEAAAKKYLGVSLEEIALAYMGPGDWKPSLSYIKDYFNYS